MGGKWRLMALSGALLPVLAWKASSFIMPLPSRSSSIQQHSFATTTSSSRWPRHGVVMMARRRRRPSKKTTFDKGGNPIQQSGPKLTTAQKEALQDEWLKGVEPPGGFEEMDIKPVRDNPVAMKPIMGEVAGMDDPLDAPWRKKAEDIIAKAVEDSNLVLYDVTWEWNFLHVDVKHEDDEAGSPTSDECAVVTKTIEKALLAHESELHVLERHSLVVGTPGASNILKTDREFRAFAGFEVHVKVKDDLVEGQAPRTMVGKLVGRDASEVTINVKGRNVRINNAFIQEVRLPEARQEEEDDPFAMMTGTSDDWEQILGLPKGEKLQLECEAEVTEWTDWGKGVTDTSDHLDESLLMESDDEEEEEGEEGMEGFGDWGVDDGEVEGEDLLKDILPDLGDGGDDDDDDDGETKKPTKKGRGKK